MILSLFFYLQIAWAGTSCQPYLGHCDYYKCLDSQYSCQFANYYSNYAHSYCELYESEEFLQPISPRGKRWLIDVKNCLMREVESYDHPSPGLLNVLQCRKISAQASLSHTNCYLEAGFCELPFGDRYRVIDSFKSEFYKPSMWLAAIKVMKVCQHQNSPELK